MTADVFVDWVTATALILGVVGAAWKWIFAELLRRQIDRRHPALEGSISVEQHPHADGKCLVKVSCFWKNLSTSKLYLDTAKTHITLYDVQDNFDLGAVSLKSAETPYLYRSEPYEGASYLFYEPGSVSEQAATFVVLASRSYGVRAVVEMDANRMKVKNVNWSRETVFFATP